MNFWIGNPWMLFGLFALAVPIIVHLLQRRKFDIVDWGAMQFLPDSIVAKRRRWLDEFLLLLMRLAMIALIVLALAAPSSTSSWLAPFRDHATRDVVLVFDGSYSMDVYVGDQPTPWSEALREAKGIVDRAPRGEQFSIIIARQPPMVWHEAFSGDAGELQSSIDAMPGPRGNSDMPAALAKAWTHLQTRSKASTREIIVFTDRQVHGWADPDTLTSLDKLGSQWHADAEQARADRNPAPALRVLKVGRDLNKTPPNFRLAPLTTSRNLVTIGQQITLGSALIIDGSPKFDRPRRVKVLLDGQPVRDILLPGRAEAIIGQIGIRFPQRFDTEGWHVVSLVLEVDPQDDALSADNQQHLPIEVVKEVPVLLVDGDKSLGPEGSSFFLQRALSARRLVPFTKFKSSDLLGNKERPAVAILADVPHLEPDAIDAIDQFLAGGGSLLIAVGERAAGAREFYNEQLYRLGNGWLPARLTEIGTAPDGVQPDTKSFQHPALELFRSAPDAAMAQVRFAKWWRSRPRDSDRAVPVAMLTSGDPFLIEMSYKKGRVVLCTTPLDRRWGSTLPNGAEFPVLVNELAYYLAGIRQSSHVLKNGAPIRFGNPGAPAQRLTLLTPEQASAVFDVKTWPWTHVNTGALGGYEIKEANGRATPFIVPPDLRESDLTRCSEADWRKVRDRLLIAWRDDDSASTAIQPTEEQSEELWWLLLIGVLGLLCTEVWMTRRMALARGR